MALVPSKAAVSHWVVVTDTIGKGTPAVDHTAVRPEENSYSFQTDRRDSGKGGGVTRTPDLRHIQGYAAPSHMTEFPLDP